WNRPSRRGMSVRDSWPLLGAGFTTWAIAILPDGTAPLRSATIALTAAALSVLVFVLLRIGERGDGRYRRPPPRWPRGVRPLAADCPAEERIRARRALWVPPRIRYESSRTSTLRA